MFSDVHAFSEFSTKQPLSFVFSALLSQPCTFQAILISRTSTCIYPCIYEVQILCAIYLHCPLHSTKIHPDLMTNNIK